MPGRVFITRAIPEPGPSLVAAAADHVDANPEDRGLSRPDLLAAVPGHDAILCVLTDRIDAEVLEAARGCRVVANFAVGFDNIDVAAATRLGIWVTNTPGVLTEATADLAWALILAVSRRVVEGDAEVRDGRFAGWGPFYMLGGDVTGATLGLVGPGRIARAVAERAAGFRQRRGRAPRRGPAQPGQPGGPGRTSGRRGGCRLNSADFADRLSCWEIPPDAPPSSPAMGGPSRHAPRANAPEGVSWASCDFD